MTPKEAYQIAQKFNEEDDKVDMCLDAGDFYVFHFGPDSIGGPIDFVNKKNGEYIPRASTPHTIDMIPADAKEIDIRTLLD
jgi:hypothetical protein